MMKKGGNMKNLKKVENDREKCKDAFLHFLEKNLSTVNYKRSIRYVNDLFKKSNEIMEIWNQKFYFDGLENKKDYFQIEVKLIEKNELKYKELAKSFFVLLVKQARNMIDFTDKLNNMKSIFDITIGIDGEILPVEEIFKILELTDNEDRNKICDKLHDIVYDKENGSIEDAIESILKEYSL